VKTIQKILLYTSNLPTANRSWLGFHGRKLVAEAYFRIISCLLRVTSFKNPYYKSHKKQHSPCSYTYLLLEDAYFFASPNALDLKITEAILQKLDKAKCNNISNVAHGKKFMFDLIKSIPNEAFLDISRDILRFSFMKSIDEYLGEDSRITSIKLLKSPPSVNTEYTKSQLFHFDDQSKRMIKIIIPISDIDKKSGPFTFIPAKQSKIISKKMHYGFPFKDSNISVMLENKFNLFHHSLDLISSGTPTWLCIDTSRCLHMGSRKVNNERILLMISLNGGLRTTLLPEPISVSIKMT